MKAISYWILKAIVDTYPNDEELGREIRRLIKEQENGK